LSKLRNLIVSLKPQELTLALTIFLLKDVIYKKKFIYRNKTKKSK